MKRVILVTFAFMGWAWYEMSGGSEYQAGTNSVTLLASVDVSTLPPANSQVARANTTSINLNGVVIPKTNDDVVQAAIPVKPLITLESAKVNDVVAAAAQAPVQAASTSFVPKWASQQAAPAVDASRSAETIVAAAATLDFRKVTGNSVNLRGGPSTSYGVITQLLRGEQVEVLDDAGDGWVKLRALDGEEIGWMSSDFLVAAN